MSVFFRDIKDKIERGRRIGVGGLSLNINTRHSSLQKRIAVATSGINATAYGRGGLIKVHTGTDDNVRFLVTATGKVFDTLEEAVNENTELGLMEVKKLSEGFDGDPRYQSLDVFQKKYYEGVKKATNQYAVADGFFADIKQALRQLTPEQKDALQRAGIDIDSIDTLQAQILTLAKDQQEGAAAVVERIEAAKKSGKLNGIFIPDDGGGRMLMFSQTRSDGTRKVLDAYQTNLLLAKTGHGYFSSDDLNKILSSALSDPKSAYEDLAGLMEKLPKRGRAFLSTREIALEGESLSSVITQFIDVPFSKRGKIPGATLSELTLVRDNEYEILAKFAMGTDYDFGGGIRGNALKEFYSQMDADQVVRNTLSRFKQGNLDQAAIDELRAHVKTFITNNAPSDQKFLSDDLLKYLESSFASTDQRKIALSGLFESFEKSVDGFDVVNKRFMDQYMLKLRDEKQTVDAILSGQTLSAEQRQLFMEQQLSITDKIERLERGDYYQITGRGRVKFGNRYLNIKNAVSAENEFVGEHLENYAMVLSRHSLKGQTSIAGEQESLILSGIGNAREAVYADAVSLSFNPEIFVDEESLKAIMRHQQEVIEDFQEVIDNGVVPDRVRKQIAHQASVDINALPISERATAAKNKEFARSIEDLLRSGVSPRDHPALMSMLHKFHATMAFKEKTYRNGTFFGAALPQTHRFSLSTEMGQLGVTKKGDRAFKLGEGVEKNIVMKTSSGSEIISEIGTFRIKGHQMILPHTAVGEDFHALGGFDLDDKGIARVVTYEDNAGMKRLGFNIFRQPSGPEEVLFKRMLMDEDSIRGMFGHDRFKRELKAIISGEIYAPPGVDPATLEALNKILNSKPAGSYSKDLIEDAIARISESMGSTYQLSDKAIAKLSAPGGTGVLSLGDLTEIVDGKVQSVIPEYTKLGIYKAFTENDVFTFDEDILKKLSGYGIDDSVRDIINQGLGGLSSDDLLNKLAITAQSADKKDEVFAAIATMVDEISRKKSRQELGNLGTYVNRSSVIGSVLDQYQDYLRGLGKNSAAAAYLTDINNLQYQAGLIAQEEAIDASVNLSVSKKLHLGTRQNIVDNIGIIDENALGAQLSKYFKIAQTGGTVTVDDIGQAGISSLGRIAGFTRAVGGAGDFERGIGIDKFALNTKLTNADRENLVRSIIAGMEDAMNRSQQGAFALSRDRLEVEEELSKFKSLIRNGYNDNEAKKLLDKYVGLDKTSKYQTFSALNMEETARQMEAMYKGAINRQILDPVSTLARSSLEEDAIAAQLLDSHAEDLGRYYKAFSEDIKSLSEIDKAYLAIRKREIGETLLTKIDEASKLEGVSRSGLFNALYKTGNQIGFDPVSLLYFEGSSIVPGDVSESAAQTLHDLLLNRRLNQFNAVRGMSDELRFNAESLLAQLMQGNPQADIGDMKAVARNILDQGSPSILEKNILQAFLGKGSEISDLAQRRQAEFESGILNTLIDINKVEREGGLTTGFNSTTRETIDEATQRLGQRGTGQVGDVLQNFSQVERDALNGALNLDDPSSSFWQKTKYNRFSLADFKEGGKFYDLAKSPSVRKGAFAVAGLIVGSFLYSSYKGRSESEMQGPPLLPGGSPYEDALPAPSNSMPNLSSEGYNTGVSYNVSLYGDRKSIAEFNKNAGGLTNGNINTTMYSRIPDVGRDPYSSLASSY